ncbi:MAG: flagellar export chaperone FliS [Bacillota bacterium]|uniref:flagellar export chaperone FliS n=1 Tax=Desulfurispora thermophila TaxID=265470 RepID=UPI00037C6D00|nr:flagellar export chaperone FliS [Desulfurispora thermophila]
MSLPNPYQQYRQNAVNSAAPGELTLMLYNGAIKFLHQAREAIAAKDVPGAHEALVRAQEIIQYLFDTLDMQYEIAGNLAALYDFILRQLRQANIKKDVGPVEEVLPLLEDLRDTWGKALLAVKGRTT